MNDEPDVERIREDALLIAAGMDPNDRSLGAPDKWQLSEQLTVEGQRAVAAIEHCLVVGRLALYKGKLGAFDVVVLGYAEDQGNGLFTTTPIAIVSHELMMQVECEGGRPK